MKSFFALCFCASVAAAQTSPVSDSAAVRRLIDSARAAGLPAEPLLGVVQRANQRHVSAARVLTAVRDNINALDRAKRALGPRSTGDEIAAGADVLLSGANVPTLAAIRAARPNGDITVSLVVLADLILGGVPVSSAEDALVTVTRAGASDAALLEFRVGVQRDLTAGQGAESSLLKRTRETVLRFQPGGPRKPPGVQFEDATIYSMTRGVPPQTLSRALASAMSVSAGAIAQTRATATPFAALPGLTLRGAVDIAIDGSSGAGLAGGEAIAAFGASHTRAGAALGIGASAASGGLQRSPVAYGAAWLNVFGFTSRFEARSAHLSSGSATRFTDDSPLTQSFVRAAHAAAVTVDTGETNPPPPTFPPAGPDSGGVTPAAASPNTISDFRFELSRRFGRVNVEGATGLRLLDHRPLDSWAALDVATWIRPSVAIVSGWSTRRTMTGTQLPGSMNAILGLRWRPGGSAPASSVARPTRAVHVQGSLRRIGSATEFVLTGVTGRRVEVSGDFTEWSPVDMVATDASHWRIELPRGRTMVRFHVRVDGGEWIVPAGVPRTRDVFGEELGALVLDAAAKE